MADKYQTQCPHCGVKFQITAQQLALANGTVRCGSCLQVFQASQNLLPIGEKTPGGAASARPASARPSAAPQPPKPAAAPATPRQAAAPARPAPVPPPPPADGVDDDLADMILRELDAAPTAPATPTAPPATRQTPPAHEPQWTPPPAQPQATPSWGAAVPPPAGGTPGAAPQWTVPPPAPSGGAGKIFGAEENRTRIAVGGELNDALLRDDPFGAATPPAPHHDIKEHAGDESWTKALLGQGDERDERIRKFQISADELSIADRTDVQPRSGLAARLQEMEHSERGRGDTAPVSRVPTPEGLDDELDFLNEPGLTMQDVELPTLDTSDTLSSTAFGAHEVSWGREIFWGTLTAVFAITLFAQYLTYNFDTLSRDDDWRGLYSGACSALGCTLPTQSDVARIQGANLVIRSHPAIENALVVDAIVYNRAPFTQPFPLLEISFTNLQGDTVAGRVFKPEEYLQGEMKGATGMPVDTPIHLSLELVDPGEGASNYEIRFLPRPPAA